MMKASESGRALLVGMLPKDAHLRAREIAASGEGGDVLRFFRSFGYTDKTAGQLAIGIFEEMEAGCR